MEYLRELRLLVSVMVTLALAGLSEDSRRFRLRNEFFAPDGNLAARKLTAPPEALAGALSAMVRTDDFEVLPPRSR